ncbi:MAG: tRNA(Ile)-lysidine synthase [Legionellaceae bacterium]
MLKTLHEPFLKYLSNAKTVWIAFSGGLDSCVLLDLLIRMQSELNINLKAIHIHHGLSENADQWQQHCEKIALHYGIPLQTIGVNAKAKKGESPEAAARNARYQAFKKIIETDDVLLTAHHQDDQAETLLLQLLRGAGVKGLAAMPLFNSFGKGYHFRPLLSFTQDELCTYANQYTLTWVTDESNAEIRFNRNYLRHHSFPLLKVRWPALTKTLARTAEHCAEAAELMDSLAMMDIEQVKGHLTNILIISKLKKLSKIRQKNVIRYWLTNCQLSTPNAKHMEQIFNTVLDCAKDANPKVCWSNVEIRRFRDLLYALLNNDINNTRNSPLTWNNQEEPLVLPQGLGQLNCEFKQGVGIKKTYLENPLTISFRQGGERFYPEGRQGSHPLKKCFQEWNIPSWQRDKIPLVYANNELIAVIGYGISEPYRAKGEEWGGIITLTK